MTPEEIAVKLESLVKEIRYVPPAPEPTGNIVKILHWNTHHAGKRTDGTSDTIGLAKWIAKINPDIALLNEMDSYHNAEQVNKTLAATTAINWAFGFDGDIINGNSIHVRRSSSIITGIIKTHPGFPSAPDRACLYQDTYPSVATIHLDAYHQSDRRIEINNTLVGFGDRLPMIWSGDWNAHEGDIEYNAIINSGYYDAWKTAKSAGVAVNYPDNCDGCTKSSRIDFIFLKYEFKCQILKMEIPDTRDANGIMPSDHKPLLLTLGY